MGSFDGAVPDSRALSRQTSERIETAIERGRIAMDHRASLASVASRQQRGGNPIVCPECGTELDVDLPAHAYRCERRRRGAEDLSSTKGKAL